MGRSKRRGAAPEGGCSSSLLVRARSGRDIALRSIRNLNALAQQVKTDPNLRREFRTRVKLLEEYKSQFEEYQQQILMVLVDFGQVSEYETVDALVADEMLALYRNITATFKAFVPVQTASKEPGRQRRGGGGGDGGGGPSSVRITTSSTMTVVTLPALGLPKFDGDVTGWRAFRDAFVTRVHNNPSLTDSARFHYLLTCLSGHALSVMKAIPVSSDNYGLAWNVLLDCFDNRRMLAAAYVDKMFAFNPITGQSASLLSEFVNTFQENIAALKAVSTENMTGFLLFYIGARMLDAETRHLFETTLSRTEIPTIDRLMAFVSHRSETLAKAEQELATNPPVKCFLCQNTHQLHCCMIFKKKSVLQRHTFVVENSLCYVCLESEHAGNKCPTDYKCKTCGGKHSTLLHKCRQLLKGN